MSIYGGMFCPPKCPKCFVGLHWRHAKPGAPPCPKCGHEHPEGLSFEDYQSAQAAWNKPKCSRCGIAVDERAKWFADPLCEACSRLVGRIVDLTPPSPDPLLTSMEKPKHVIAIDYGYDVHSVEVEDDTFAKIVAGEAISIDGQGFLYEEEGLVVDHWSFDLDTRVVGFMLDNGAEFSGRSVRLYEGRPAIDLSPTRSDTLWHPLLSRYGYGGVMDYLCARQGPQGIELAVCGHGWIAEVPSDWFDDDGEPLPEHRDTNGELRLPSCWEGETVTGIEERMLVGELVADDERTILLDSILTDSVAQALVELTWDEADLGQVHTMMERWSEGSAA